MKIREIARWNESDNCWSNDRWPLRWKMMHFMGEPTEKKTQRMERAIPLMEITKIRTVLRDRLPRLAELRNHTGISPELWHYER